MILVACLAWAVAQIPLSGSVVDGAGRPVAGAEVVLEGFPANSGAPIVGRAKSDEAGRFAIDRPADLAGENSYRCPSLWCLAPGYRLAVQLFPGPLPGRDDPTSITLTPSPEKGAEFRVIRPDGEAAVGAKVRVTRLRREYRAIPGEIVTQTGATTDARGLAVLPAFRHEEIGVVEVEASGLGVQTWGYYPAPRGQKVLDLRPVGSIRGRLVTDRPGPTRGWKIRATSRQVDASPSEGFVAAIASTEADEQGRFKVPEIAAGTLDLFIDWPDDAPELPVFPPTMAVVEGRENVIDVPLKPGVTLEGTVVERGTGKPVAGVEFSLSDPDRNINYDNARSGADGRYRFRTLPGRAQVRTSQSPPTHVMRPAPEVEEIAVPEGSKPITLRPREVLRAGPPLQGEVRDEAGHPVAGVTITGNVSFTEEHAEARSYFSTTSDPRGRFTLQGIAPGASVTLNARRKDLASPAPITAAAGEGRVIKVQVVPIPAVAVSGRIVGRGGEPIEGAFVTIVSQVVRNGQTSEFKMLEFDGNRQISTDKDGSYRTPRELDRTDTEYRAEVTAEGYLPGQTEWIPAGSEDVLTIPKLSLRKSVGLRTVVGRVVDTQGNPVAGATVFQSGDGPKRTEATTDADGRFRVAGVFDGPALVFAVKPDFRFGGAVVGKDGRAEIRLIRTSEPPAGRPDAKPVAMTRAEERALALRLLEPIVGDAPKGALLQTGTSDLAILARIDPERVLNLIEDRVVNDANALQQAALAQAETDPREAIATVEADQNPTTRAANFLALSHVPGQRDAMLDRAVAETLRIDDPEAKLASLTTLADTFLAANQVDRATPLLRAGQELIARLPRDRHLWNIAQFAQVLAAIDPAAAKTLAETRKNPGASQPDAQTLARQNGETAVRIAATDPAEAERLLGEIAPDFYYANQYIVRTCGRMATKDLARARRLLKGLHPFSTKGPYPKSLAAGALGLMAQNLAATDPVGARKLLDESFAGLNEGEPSYPPSSLAMAALLPLVERIDPDHLAERTLLAASRRAPRGERPENENRLLALLAVLLAPYDPPAADVVFAPVADGLPEILEGDRLWSFGGPDLLKVVAVYDPRLMARLIDGLPATLLIPPKRAGNSVTESNAAQARRATAEILSLPVEERRGEVLRRMGNEWQFTFDR